MLKREQRYRKALNDRKLLNIHEAGHAAIAAHFKMVVVRVYVSKANTSLTELKKSPPSMETLRERLAMFLGGYFALLKKTGDEFIANIHCDLDKQLMSDLFKELSVSEEAQDDWMKEARAIAEELVDRHWAAIRMIASELHKFRQMSGAEVRRILAEVQSSDCERRD
jgi:hypothetical protein